MRLSPRAHTSPLGRTIVVDKQRPVQIVGIVRDVRERSVQADPQLSLYVSQGDPDQRMVRSPRILIRTATGNPAVYRAIVEQAKTVDICLRVWRDLR